MKKILLKLLKNWVLNNLPDIIESLSKRKDKYGIVVRESIDVWELIDKSTKDDGYLDEKEIKKLAPEIAEAVGAWMNVFNKKLRIKIRKTTK